MDYWNGRIVHMLEFGVHAVAFRGLQNSFWNIPSGLLPETGDQVLYRDHYIPHHSNIAVVHSIIPLIKSIDRL